MTLINLFSDSATTPTEPMRQAMARAEVGDEQRGTDPTVNQLLSMVSQLLGKEAALFLPTGTMCNAIAIKVLTKPGQAILVDRQSHILRSETGGAAMWSGVIVDQIESTAGIFSQDQLADRLPERSVYAPAPAVVCIEQTHNFGGGTVWNIEDVRAVCQFAHEKGIATHLDGARLFNAVVATGVPAQEWCRHFDSVFIDFSKSLGAPFGAVLAGGTEFIEEARRYKHAFGGAMRQAGIMAAGCIFALENNIGRLKEDHENARLLADQLAKISNLHILTPQPHSNMVFFDTTAAGISARDFVDILSRNGVIMSAIEHRVRAVTHLGISREDCLKAAEVVQQVVSREAASAR